MTIWWNSAFLIFFFCEHTYQNLKHRTVANGKGKKSQVDIFFVSYNQKGWRDAWDDESFGKK